jgi:predicted rRNA methylase YqxC with S4 and FtsJ domains
VIEEIKTAAMKLGYGIRGVIESPLLGPAGNKEFFIHLSAADDVT